MHDIFFFTDIHGTYDLYEAIIDYCMKQDPKCTIIFGGDACDRGRRGYKIMKELLDNPNVVYLKGNHEDMFVQAAREINERFDFLSKDREYVKVRLSTTLTFDYKYPDIQLAIYNGGLETLIDWICDGASMEFVDRIDKLPLTFSYEQYDFCHAGGIYKVFSRVANAEYNNTHITDKDKQTMLWDRSSWSIGWETGRICVQGHTPTVYLRSKEYGKDKSLGNAHPCAWIGEFYGDDEKYKGWKLDMDTGAYQSGRAFIFNVLTQEVIGFGKKLDDIEVVEKYKIIFDKEE